MWAAIYFTEELNYVHWAKYRDIVGGGTVVPSTKRSTSHKAFRVWSKSRPAAALTLTVTGLCFYGLVSGHASSETNHHNRTSLKRYNLHVS